MRVVNTVNVVDDEELKRAGRELFEEDNEKIESDILTIKQWLATAPHMQNTRHDEEFLRMFLRGCNYDVTATMSKLDKFFTVRSMIPAWFDSWDPTQVKLESIWSAGVFLPLRGFDKEGRYVILVRTGHVVPDTMNIDDCWKAFIMMFTLATEQNVQANTKGFVFLLDEKKITPSHVMMLTPSTLQKLMLVFQEAYPLDNTVLIERSLIYFINMPKIMKAIMSMFLSFLNDKYKKIVRIHSSGGLDDLKEALGEDILPVEYGGTNSCIEDIRSGWREEVVAHTEWLVRHARLKTEESLREGKTKMQSDMSCSLM